MDASAQPPSTASPRQGIIHLMVWTTCVAVHLAVRNMLATPFEPSELPVGYGLLAVLQAIGGGAALAGVVLLVSRRFRRMAFPIYGGEFLLVVLGLDYVFHKVWTGIFFVVAYSFLPSLRGETTWMVAYLLPVRLAPVALCLWPIVRLRDRLWRTWFAMYMAARALIMCSQYVSWTRGPSALSQVAPALGVLAAAVFIGALIRDWLHRRQFPWTHWAGLALAVWMGVSSVVSLLLHVAEL